MCLGPTHRLTKKEGKQKQIHRSDDEREEILQQQPGGIGLSAVQPPKRKRSNEASDNPSREVVCHAAAAGHSPSSFAPSLIAPSPFGQRRTGAPSRPQPGPAKRHSRHSRFGAPGTWRSRVIFA